MCGIIGYAGPLEATAVILEGLQRMEYRGYDSAGVALYPDSEEKFWTCRAVGRVSVLKEKTSRETPLAHHGIGHTRWATHGVPSERNAHPHQSGRISLVHNGIIENHALLREELEAQGVEFTSQTDTEVFTHLLSECLQKFLKMEEGNFDDFSNEKKGSLVFKALCAARARAQGHYSVLFMVRGFRDALFAIHQGAPIVAAKSGASVFVASDLQAVIDHSKDLYFLEPGQALCALHGSLSFYSCETCSFEELNSVRINWNSEKVEKDGFDHFMMKEIFEQPLTVAETLSGRLPQDDNSPFIWDNLAEHERFWEAAERLYLVACGTAYHSALVAKYYFERIAKIPVEVDLASEFRYRDPLLSEKTVVGVISQSGETADTLAALRLAKSKGSTTFSVCNVPGSTIMRESSFQYSTRAGPEVGVASTKAFTNQLTMLCALAADVGRLRGVDEKERYGISQALSRLPHDLENILLQSENFQNIGRKLADKKTILFVGRGVMYPIALEGALKLKEITYRHAEGYAAGELKHGPIAMVDNNLSAIVLGPSDEVLAKTLSNLEEIRSRSGHIIGIGEETNSAFRKLCDEYIGLPKMHWSVTPMGYVLPAQLISYGLALHLGCDIDKPRNLAKSVTVE